MDTLENPSFNVFHLLTRAEGGKNIFLLLTHPHTIVMPL